MKPIADSSADTLHAQRWRLGRELYRETTDADLGIATVALQHVDAVALLATEQYTKTGGARFEKPALMTGEHACIDVLVPTYTSRARKSVKVGELVTTEVPGLATALLRKPVALQLNMQHLSGAMSTATMQLPDEAAACMLKALAYEHRGAGKDVVDSWRCLEILHRASVSLPHAAGDDFDKARHLLTTGFNQLTSPMMQALAAHQQLSRTAAQQRHTRIKALIKAAL